MSRLLLVDDDPIIADTMLEILRAHNLPGVSAGSGEEALEKLSEEPFDLVLLDARLPGMSGFEACQRIRERFGASLPVIILTAFGDERAVKQGFEAGADDFCTKPVDTPVFVFKVRALLRLKSFHDEGVRNREEAQSRVQSLAQLHEIGRDWSLIAEPEAFYRMVTQRLGDLIHAPICLIALYDRDNRIMEPALPVHGLSTDIAKALRYEVRPEHRGMWNFASGRPYLSNRARSDPRLIQDVVVALGIESIVLVPMMSEGRVLGLLVAANKPGGFSEGDVQVLSIFAGPAATFLRSRQIFNAQRKHGERLEHLSALMAAIAATPGRSQVLKLAVTRMQKDLGFDRVEFHATGEGEDLRLELEVGAPRPKEVPLDRELLKWALRGAVPLAGGSEAAELALPVQAGGHGFGVLVVLSWSARKFPEDEVNILSVFAGHLAVALQKTANALASDNLALQMASLYEIGLEIAALQDLRILFARATEESGRLLQAHHASVFRLDPFDSTLRKFAAWAKEPSREPYSEPVFRMGEGIAGRVAREGVPVLHNDPEDDPSFVPKANAVARLLCVPLTYYDQERKATTVFGVLNATRGPGAPPFTSDDLEFATRFAGQLSIAVANSMAFAAEHERSEQLAFVNGLIREIAGNLSEQRILEVATRRIRETLRYRVVRVIDERGGRRRIIAQSGGQPEPGESERGVGADGPTGDSPTHQAAIPIVVGGGIEAVLLVEGEGARGVGRGELITLKTLADSIGILLRNAELYSALEATNARLVEVDRTRSELINIVAHDFRAPLAGILGYAELLEWKPDLPEGDRVEHARAIIHSATHMANLVDKTLKTTRLETGNFPFDFAVTDVGAVLRSLLGRFATSDKHTLRAEIPSDPLVCRADKDRIAEVVENLLSNAVKYAPEGGEIRLEAAKDGEQLTVRVSDPGLGIAAEDLSRLFRPFSRIRTPTTASIEGSGLGLYICDRIVRAHGGSLHMESKVGSGSTCSFSLPLFSPGAQETPLVVVATVDDQTRREVGRVAEELGFGTHEVEDGVDAFEAALRLLPRVVILDRHLPRLGAEEIAERLGEQETTAGIPVVGLGLADDVASPRFWAWLPKPLDPPSLAAILRSLPALRRTGVEAIGGRGLTH